MCDENQAIDNRIIPPYVTGILKYLMHMISGIQNIRCLTQKIESCLQGRLILLFIFDIYETNFSFQLQAIFQRSRRLKTQNFLLGMNHGHHTDFSQLINLSLVKKFSLISTPVNLNVMDVSK